jgi:HK97 gp10 family phage protein
MPDGFEKLIAQLHSLQGEELRKIERTALQAVSNVITPALIEAAPIQAGVPEGILAPGELKASIKPRVHVATDQQRTQREHGSYLVIKPVDKDLKGYKAVQGPYSVAVWLEYGHAGPKSSSPRTKPHPFVRPTVDAVQAKAVETYATTMTEEIKRVTNA